MALDGNALRKRLEKFDQARLRWFAARCALHVMPVFGAYKNLDFNKDPERHICGVYRALNSAFLFDQIDESSHNIERRYAAARAARAARAADARVVRVAFADATTHAADAAYAAAYAADADAAFETAILTDLEALEAGASIHYWPPLWPEGRPERFDAWEGQLLERLEAIGQGYWVRRYREWIRGEFNQPLLERALFLPDEFIDHSKADIPALMAYLEAGERLEDPPHPDGVMVDIDLENERIEMHPMGTEEEYQNPLNQQMLEELRTAYNALSSQFDGGSNQHPALKAALDDYGQLLTPPIQDIRIIGLWTIGRGLIDMYKSFQIPAEDAQRLTPDLEPEVMGLLGGFLAAHGGFVQGFSVAKDLTERVGKELGLTSEQGQETADATKVITGAILDFGDYLGENTRILYTHIKGVLEAADKAYTETTLWTYNKLYPLAMPVTEAMYGIARWAYGQLKQYAGGGFIAIAGDLYSGNGFIGAIGMFFGAAAPYLGPLMGSFPEIILWLQAFLPDFEHKRKMAELDKAQKEDGAKKSDDSDP